MNRSAIPSWSSSMLRRDLSDRAHHLARAQNTLHDISPGPNPVVIFGHDEHGHHGNFHPGSYARIQANPAWLRRLTKPHTASRRSRARKDWQWMELDTCNSSDALLMNIFCHPGVFNGTTIAPPVARLLNIDPHTEPHFGITPGIPLKNSRKGRSKLPVQLTDRTEIDLHLGNLFIEAKLTESNFQTAAPRLVERYCDLEAVFDIARLPRKLLSVPSSHPPIEDYSQDEVNTEPENSRPTTLMSFRPDPERSRGGVEKPASLPPPSQQDRQSEPQIQYASPSTRTLINGYQLIRNVLAAYDADAAFCVLSDARRHDLIETWYSILSAVHSPTFATRLKLLTWQELSTTLPQDLQQFLETKYGILPA
jgi:hypothetical protein